MDPYSSPYIIPNNNPYTPFLHSLLSTRESVPFRRKRRERREEAPVAISVAKQTGPMQSYIGLLYWGHVGIMEKKMETTILLVLCWGYIACEYCILWNLPAYSGQCLQSIGACRMWLGITWKDA